MKLIIVTICMAIVATSRASPVDLPGLGGVSGLLSTAVQSTAVVQEPLNSGLKGLGLTPCAQTIVLSKYVGTCIPADLKCIGVNVLDKLTGKLVNIPACGAGTTSTVTQQSVTQGLLPV